MGPSITEHMGQMGKHHSEALTPAKSPSSKRSTRTDGRHCQGLLRTAAVEPQEGTGPATKTRTRPAVTPGNASASLYPRS